MIKSFFSPPVFDNDEDNFRARFINGFAWVAIVLLALGMIPYLSGESFDFTVSVLTGLILVMLTSIYLLRKGFIRGSGFIIIVLGWLGLGIQAYTADGVKDVIVTAYIALGLLASIIVSWRAGSFVILSSIGVIWALALLENNGIFSPRYQEPITFARDLTFVFLAITALIFFSTSSLRDAIRRATKSEEGLRMSNKELQQLNQTLEDRVSERTANLESANQRNTKRVKQFEAIAEVARATTANESLETLLPRIASIVSEQFGFYHTGIFLLDEAREFAVLSAANSEGGKRMLERGHKLQIGQTGMVGFASATGTPRIALDVGDDAVFFDNPDLPDTRSEMALPLRIVDEIIGVLDVQSREENAFQEEDIEVLSILADQVAVAIQNSRTYQSMQDILEEAQRVSGSYLQDSWRVLQSENKNVGYRVLGDEVAPLNAPLSSAQINKAMQNSQTVAESGANAALAIPIRLRNEVIGVMDIRNPEEHDWDDDEIDIAEAVADRLSLALETSLLLKSTQRQAEIERITADISNKIGATSQFDSILRTAAEELSRVLGGSEVLVQLHQDQYEEE
ncbi:MAG: GAF domain-containing protein [Anaerolineales bacterium]|nr:GAF domain-containing protein [Anaerolineales bacterium]